MSLQHVPGFVGYRQIPFTRAHSAIDEEVLFISEEMRLTADHYFQGNSTAASVGARRVGTAVDIDD